MYVSHLRKTVGKERLETKAPGYRLRVAGDELDLDRFQRLADGRPREPLAPWLAHTQGDYGRMLLARRRANDGATAEPLLDAALSAYRELGMTRPLESARAPARS